MSDIPPLSTDTIPEQLLPAVQQTWEVVCAHAALQPSQIVHEPRIAHSFARVCASSTFVANHCARQPELITQLVNDTRLFACADQAWLAQDLTRSVQQDGSELDWQRTLRQFRLRHMVRIAWRDIAGWAELSETLQDLSMLADCCVRCAYAYQLCSLTQLYGVPCGRDSGTAQPLLILGMGKLGGRELNYSSDIDLIFLYPEEGETNAATPTDNAEFFLRLGQRIIQSLANVTADGFVFRVDMRLRPFGDSGPLAISFDSFEDYLQQHGRDWERYAFIKARPITAIEHYENLYAHVIRPFVYRRYLDFSVFESLRTMKQMIACEVQRRELHDNIKLGPGGIREIEFIVQSLQLLRGGGDKSLQSAELQTVLPRLVGLKLLSSQAVHELSQAYQLLRRVENRLQQWNDESTHLLPQAEMARLRLAVSLQLNCWDELDAMLKEQRACVSRHFADIVLGPALHSSPQDAELENLLSPGKTEQERLSLLAALGVQAPMPIELIEQQLVQLREGGYYRKLDTVGRHRLQALLPRIMCLLRGVTDPVITCTRVFNILERIGGRTVYLALLNENTAALQRLVDLCVRSQFLADQIAAFPLLLDELIDARLLDELPTRATLHDELQLYKARSAEEEEERQVEILLEYQRIALFRIAVADLTGRLPIMQVSDRLTDLAELIVQQALALAWGQVVNKLGVPFCGPHEQALRAAGVVVVAYGKLGGIELGFSSDLDLVFLHDSTGEIQQTHGTHSVDNDVFFARLGQRLVHLLTVHTRMGRLYEVDTRLRPSGKGGLLVQGIQHFKEYQRQEAWVWEHQALLRARAIAGQADLIEGFERMRIEILREAVHRDKLRNEVRSMRERMRAELPKTKPGLFNIKQDAGGLTDIEFMVQYWVLKWARDYPPVIIFSDNIRQLESLASAALVPQAEVDFLTQTYRRYRERMHHLSLAGLGNTVAECEFVAERQQVSALWHTVMSESNDFSGIGGDRV